MDRKKTYGQRAMAVQQGRDSQTRNVTLSGRALRAIDVEQTFARTTQRSILEALCEAYGALDQPSQRLLLGQLPIEYCEDAARRLADQLVAYTRERLAQAEAEADPHPPPEKEERRAAS